MALHHLCQPLPAWHRCHRNRIHQWCRHSGGRGPRAGSCRPNSGRRGNHLLRFGRNRQQFFAGSGATQAHSNTNTTPTTPQGYFFTCQTLPLLSNMPTPPYLWQRHGPPAAANAKRPTPAARTTHRPPLTTAYSPSNQPLLLSSTTTSSTKT